MIPILKTIMRSVVSALAAVALLAACQSSGKQAAPVPPVPPAPTVLAGPTEPSCPVLTRQRFSWPASVPADLPQPPSALLGPVNRTVEGLTIVKFTTATSLQQGVLFVVREVQAAGYTLGRGDAEPGEADAPFGRAGLHGIYRMSVHDACTTDWIVAVASVGAQSNSPLLPTRPMPHPSPLPFG